MAKSSAVKSSTCFLLLRDLQCLLIFLNKPLSSEEPGAPTHQWHFLMTCFFPLAVPTIASYPYHSKSSACHRPSRRWRYFYRRVSPFPSLQPSWGLHVGWCWAGKGTGHLGHRAPSHQEHKEALRRRFPLNWSCKTSVVYSKAMPLASQRQAKSGWRMCWLSCQPWLFIQMPRYQL